MPIDHELLAIIADPLDKQPLSWNAAERVFINLRRRVAYRLHAGIPVLLAGEAIVSGLKPDGDMSALLAERQVSKYEGLSDWYEQLMRDPSGRGARLAAAIADLTHLVGRGKGLALDVGCGTGIVAGAMVDLGYKPVGMDLAGDQLQIAAKRLPVVQGSATELPFLNTSVALVYSTFTSSAWERQAESIREIFRVLQPGGRYVDVGIHPCFNGGYAEALDDGSVLQKPGYLESGYLAPSSFKSPIRSRVGAWHRPLAGFLNAFVDAGFRLDRVVEGGEGDKRQVPSLIGIRAVKP